MRLWRQLARGLRALIRRPAADRDVADEVQHYLDQAAAEQRARGLSPEAALRAARLELGGVTAVKEQVRSYGWENAIDALIADLRHAARRLRATPGFTAVAVLTLALGVGATTAIWSAVSPILFEPLPYPDAGQVTMVWYRGSDGARADQAYGTYRELAERSKSFATLAAVKPWQPTLTGAGAPGRPERVEGQRVTAGYFRVLGVPPALGRDFVAGEDQPNGPRAVLLGDGLWRRRYGADRTVVGRLVTVDGDPALVIGVMPAGFENVLAPRAELWTTLQYDLAQGRAWGHHLRIVGRLRDGAELEGARRELDAIAAHALPELPRPGWAAMENGLIVSSVQDEVTRGVRPALLAILGAVLLVLVIACVNVANLLLARGVRRRGELALRAALGAGRGRLIQQQLVESLLLAALGGAAGMGVALAGVDALLALSPPGLPRAGAIAVDASGFGFGLIVTTVVGLALGVMPALQAARSDPRRDLGERRTTGGHRRARGALVIAEVALALVLLVSSGLLWRSLGRLFAVEAGFDPANVLTMQVQTSGHHFDSPGARTRFFDEALAAVRRVPGVAIAGLTSQLPLTGESDLYGVHFDPPPPGDGEAVGGTFRYAVSPGYLEAMHIPLRVGRLLDERDREGAPLAALISESLARRRLSGLDPIGRRLRIGAEDGPRYTVVGVVGDVKQLSLALDQAEAVYVTPAQWRFDDAAMSLVVRARGDAASQAPAVRRAVASVDADQAITRVATLDDLLTASAAERRFAMILFEAFALAALILAAVGIYGVLSGSVAERTREIGVRAALGASRADLLGLVLRQGMTLTALGVALGLVGAMLATQALVALLFGVSPLDPLTYLGGLIVLAGVALAACALPAWRAARVDPASTLRAE